MVVRNWNLLEQEEASSWPKEEKHYLENEWKSCSIVYNRNYTETTEKYQVSYQQARCYTVKYKTGGVEALKDRWGKRKSPDEMTELEKLRAEIKILRAEKEHAEMEASFLKKLKEIERRRGWAWFITNT